MNTILQAENLAYIYSQNTPFEKKAVSGLNFAIEKGSFTGVIGHTGSGKSTLMQLLNGLLKPSEGRILFDGQDIWQSKSSVQKLRFSVGLVFQYPEYQLFAETVEKDVAFGPQNMKLPEAEIKERVLTACEFTGIDKALLSQSPFELSGGQKRRVAIAGVIAMQPQVLILDEPTAGLDPKGKAEILENIMSYQKNTGATILLVTHSMNDIARVAQNILVMNRGELAYHDTLDAVFSQDAELQDMGLSLPQVTLLTARLKAAGIPFRRPIYTVEQAREELLYHLKNKEN